MRKLEKTLVILIVLATLGKIIPIPGSSILLTIAMLALALLYFPMGFALFTKIGFRDIFKRTSYVGLNPWDIILSILTGYAFLSLTCSILFKFNYWPGSDFMTISALITATPFLIIAFPLLKSKDRFVYVGILKRGIPLFLLTLVLSLVPVTTRLKIIKVNPAIDEQIRKEHRHYE